MNFKDLSKKQMIVFLITCLALLIVLNLLIVNLGKSDEEEVVDYKDSTGASLIEGASVEYDRVVCYNVEKLLKQYIDSFDERYGKATYMDYYKKSVTDDYKKYNSKMKYRKQANNFYSKIIEYSTIGTKRGDQLITEKSLYNQEMLEKIYKIEGNYYICELQLRNETKAYIGLYFDSDNKAYIFYIE